MSTRLLTELPRDCVTFTLGVIALFASAEAAHANASAHACVGIADSGCLHSDNHSGASTASATATQHYTSVSVSSAAHAVVDSGSIFLNATSASTDPGAVAFALAGASFTDYLQFHIAHEILLDGRYQVSQNNLFSDPFSPIQIEITDRLSYSADAGSRAAVTTTFGTHAFNVGSNGWSHNDPADVISTDFGDPQYVINVNSILERPVGLIPLMVRAEVFAQNGTASLYDPLTFTFLDNNGTIIPNVSVLSSNGYSYTVNSPSTLHGVPDPISSVPEPPSWALLLLGFGGVGSLLRRVRSHAGAHAV